MNYHINENEMKVLTYLDEHADGYGSNYPVDFDAMLAAIEMPVGWQYFRLPDDSHWRRPLLQDLTAFGVSADPGFGLTQLMMPHRAAVMLTAIVSAARLLAWRRARRRDRAGICRRCGDDLRASPARCPECGSFPVRALTGAA